MGEGGLDEESATCIVLPQGAANPGVLGGNQRSPLAPPMGAARGLDTDSSRPGCPGCVLKRAKCWDEEAWRTVPLGSRGDQFPGGRL